MSCQPIQTLGRIYIPAAWTSGLRLWMVVPWELRQILTEREKSHSTPEEGLEIPGAQRECVCIYFCQGWVTTAQRKFRGFWVRPVCCLHQKERRLGASPGRPTQRCPSHETVRNSQGGVMFTVGFNIIQHLPVISQRTLMLPEHPNSGQVYCT